MSKYFCFEQYKNHNLYHARLGRGAVVVAIDKDPKNRIDSRNVNSDLYVAGYFCSREQNLDKQPQHLDPIRSIKENEGFVEIEIEFNRLRGSTPRRQSISAVVRRVLPRNQVTLEVIDQNYSA